ncbi:MAG: carboxy terminal-processing peptidase [Pseudomonadales bacterium]
MHSNRRLPFGPEAADHVTVAPRIRWRGLRRGAVRLLAALLAAGGVFAWAQTEAPAGAPAGPPAEPSPQLAYASTERAPDLTPLDVHPRTLLTIVEQLRHNHFLDKKLDDGLSSEIFDNYLDMLDGARVYFTAADVTELEKYRSKLDDALVRGNLEPAFEIFNTYQQRLIERLQFLLTEIDAGLDKMDFSLDEAVAIDRESAPWPEDQAEMDDIWRKRLKAAALTMKLNGKPVEEIEELLSKRYKNRLKQAGQTKSEDAFQLYVNAFATSYDPHTQYFSPRTSQNFNINMSLQLEGIGAVLRNEDEYTSVVELVPAGPADKSGMLSPSDRIVSVGQGEDGPLIDVVGWRLDDVVELIRGPKDSTVRLEVIPHTAADAATRVVTITRDAVQLEEQAAHKKLLTLNEGGTEHRIGIIEVPTFYADFKAIQQGDPNYKSTTRDVHRLIDELKAENIEALVIDLRNNGGGSLQEADAMTGLFIKSGPTVQVKSANRRPSIYADNDDAVAWDGPMAVLVNRLSASASEIFAGAIQDYERGLIIGSQTFGKGTVQTLIPLNRGQLKITAAKFYRVSGQSTQHQGIIPDIEFPEIYDAERIGESSLEDAMPWDMISPAVYPRGDDIHPLLAELNARHLSRVADDPDFKYMRALALKTREDAKQTYLSLNEQVRSAEQKRDDAWRLELENGLRAAKGEAPLASIEALEEAATERTDDEDEDPSDDAMLRESGQILVDYISLTRQVALAEHHADAGGVAIQ